MAAQLIFTSVRFFRRLRSSAVTWAPAIALLAWSRTVPTRLLVTWANAGLPVVSESRQNAANASRQLRGLRAICAALVIAVLFSTPRDVGICGVSNAGMPHLRPQPFQPTGFRSC